MATLELWVNEVVSSSVKWTEVGAVPQLDTQNQPTQYIYTTGRRDTSDVYGFTDSGHTTESITSVFLYVYSETVATSDFTTTINATNTGLTPATTWGWTNVDVSSILTTWAGIDAATLVFQHANTTNLSNIDAAYLYVTYVGLEVKAYVTHQ